MKTGVAVLPLHRGSTLNLIADKSAGIQEVITSFSHERPEKLIRELFLLKEMKLPHRHSPPSCSSVYSFPAPSALAATSIH
jgi:hypothetical protein